MGEGLTHCVTLEMGIIIVLICVIACCEMKEEKPHKELSPVPESAQGRPAVIASTMTVPTIIISHWLTGADGELAI